jgi:hypothetical protein
VPCEQLEPDGFTPLLFLSELAKEEEEGEDEIVVVPTEISPIFE